MNNAVSLFNLRYRKETLIGRSSNVKIAIQKEKI
jgi:hypothetical protein